MQITIPSAIGSAVQLGNSIIQALPRSQPSTFSAILSKAGAVVSQLIGLNDVRPEYLDLLNQQIKVQEEMQLISMHSNIEKSRHETQMAAIRNVRVG